MNQQIPNQFGIPQMPALPSTKELWQNEKKYRPWIIIFGVGLLIIIALTIASSAYKMSNYEAIKDVWYNNFFEGGYQQAKALELAEKYAYNEVYVNPIFYLVIMAIGALLYGTSLTRSYQTKSFARLSMFSNTILFFYAIFEIFDLFTLMWNSEKRGAFTPNAGSIIGYVNTVLVIVLAFTAGREVSKIRRQFFMSERMEAIKNQMAIMTGGQFQANSQPFVNSPFGPIPQNVQPGSTPPVTPLPVNLDANGQPQVQEIPKSPEQIRLEKLNSLTDEQIHEIAAKLSISGHETMTKEELVIDIMRITKDSTHFN